MTDAAQQASRPRWMRCTLILVAGIPLVVAGFVLGYLTCGVVQWQRGTAAEYHTARTIRDITDFVESNSRWPSSWQDLGTAPWEGVVVNWSIDLSACDRHDIMTSITPETGRYRTYPHAELDLNRLWLLVQEFRGSPHEERSN